MRICAIVACTSRATLLALIFSDRHLDSLSTYIHLDPKWASICETVVYSIANDNAHGKNSLLLRGGGDRFVIGLFLVEERVNNNAIIISRVFSEPFDVQITVSALPTSLAKCDIIKPELSGDYYLRCTKVEDMKRLRCFNFSFSVGCIVPMAEDMSDMSVARQELLSDCFLSDVCCYVVARELNSAHSFSLVVIANLSFVSAIESYPERVVRGVFELQQNWVELHKIFPRLLSAHRESLSESIPNSQELQASGSIIHSIESGSTILIRLPYETAAPSIDTPHMTVPRALVQIINDHTDNNSNHPCHIDENTVGIISSAPIPDNSNIVCLLCRHCLSIVASLKPTAELFPSGLFDAVIINSLLVLYNPMYCIWNAPLIVVSMLMLVQCRTSTNLCVVSLPQDLSAPLTSNHQSAACVLQTISSRCIHAT